MAETPGRADPFGDLGDFQPTPVTKLRIERDAVRQVSEANNFPSRSASVKPETPTKDKRQRRRRTGRNVQFNIKATPETIARFIELADKHGWVFGETLDYALDALERSPPVA
jgi:hypothetical protein